MLPKRYGKPTGNADHVPYPESHGCSYIYVTLRSDKQKVMGPNVFLTPDPVFLTPGHLFFWPLVFLTSDLVFLTPYPPVFSTPEGVLLTPCLVFLTPDPVFLTPCLAFLTPDPVFLTPSPPTLLEPCAAPGCVLFGVHLNPPSFLTILSFPHLAYLPQLPSTKDAFTGRLRYRRPPLAGSIALTGCLPALAGCLHWLNCLNWLPSLAQLPELAA